MKKEIIKNILIVFAVILIAAILGALTGRLLLDSLV